MGLSLTGEPTNNYVWFPKGFLGTTPERDNTTPHPQLGNPWTTCFLSFPLSPPSTKKTPLVLLILFDVPQKDTRPSDSQAPCAICPAFSFSWSRSTSSRPRIQVSWGSLQVRPSLSHPTKKGTLMKEMVGTSKRTPSMWGAVVHQPFGRVFPMQNHVTRKADG